MYSNNMTVQFTVAMTRPTYCILYADAFIIYIIIIINIIEFDS